MVTMLLDSTAPRPASAGLEQQNEKHVSAADLVHGHTTYLFLWRPSSTKSG